MSVNPIVLSLGGMVFASLLAWLSARYWFVKNAKVAAEAELRRNKAAADVELARVTADAAAKLAAKDAQIQANIVELQRRLSVMDQTVLPLTTQFMMQIGKQLTHPERPEADKLINGALPPFNLSDAEYRRLLAVMKEREHDPTVSPSEQDAALMFPPLIRAVRDQPGENGEMPELKVVAVLEKDRDTGEVTMTQKTVSIPTDWGDLT